MIDPAMLKVRTFEAAADKLGLVLASEPNVGGFVTETMGTPAYQDWTQTYDHACNACYTALDDLLATEPTTKAGAVAVLMSFLEYERPFLEPPIVNLEKLIRQSVRLA